MGLIRRNYFLLVVIAVASLLRLLWLDRVPNAIGGDEMVYLLTAKSIFLFGSDIVGNWNPLSIIYFQYPFGEFQAELPYFLFLPAVGPFASTLFTARIVNAILGILSVALVYLIAEKLIDKRTAFFAGLVAAINPWLIFISRSSYDMGPSVFFYLLALYILIKFKKNLLFIIP